MKLLVHLMFYLSKENYIVRPFHSIAGSRGRVVLFFVNPAGGGVLEKLKLKIPSLIMFQWHSTSAYHVGSRWMLSGNVNRGVKRCPDAALFYLSFQSCSRHLRDGTNCTRSAPFFHVFSTGHPIESPPHPHVSARLRYF